MTGWPLVVGPALVACAVALLRGPRPDRRLDRRVRRPRAAGPAAEWVRRLMTRRRRTEPRVVGAWVEAWAAAARSGRPVGLALDDAITDVPRVRLVLPRTAVASAFGGDVADAMRLDAQSSSGSVRRTVLAAAACWTVARDHGGRLADALDRLGDAVRAESLHVAHVRAQLAGPRATARLLAALPAFALLLGAGMGLDPVAVLLGEPLGRGLLVAGVVLEVGGLWWTERLARAAEGSA